MKSDANLPFKSATELVSDLANKKISAVELLDATITRIESLDKKINAVVVRDFERARQSAIAADAAIARGNRLPLLGLPITVKESFNVAGFTTTWGNVVYKDWQPNYEALTISRLKAAGAIIIGKTNIPYMLQDFQSYNDLYGTTNNPWDLTKTPGGSSGGSAAALAAGFVALELGSDLAGSVRVPAHFCGVFAHKPSIDLIPMRGSGPPSMPPTPARVDLAVQGPMARTAVDLSLALDIIAGPDEMLDGKGYKLALPIARHDQLSDYRVLIIDTHPLCPTSSMITHSINNLADRLIKSGATVSRDMRNVPDLAAITKNYAFMLTAFFAADMPAEENEKAINAVKALQANDTSLSASLLRGSACTHGEWLIETRLRGQLRQQWRNLYNDFDVVICPVMPTPAFSHDHSINEKRHIEVDGSLIPYDDLFVWSSIATVFGLPATATPIDLSKNGLPIGVQVIGDYLEDYTTIKFASLIECEFGGFSRPGLMW